MIAENIHELIQEIGHTAQIVVVTKNRTLEEVQAVYACGQRHFAENRVQALVEKETALPKDIHWHLIGHLQTNKVKYIASFVHCIQSVDSLKLLRVINKEAAEANRVIDCLLQVRIAQEETKFGLTESACLGVLETLKIESFEHVRVIGLMGMASHVEDVEQVSQEYNRLKEFYDSLHADYGFTTLSMGMSSDYRTALSCGSTMIRIGSRIFE